MSVKDFNKVYDLKNMTTGEIIKTIDDDLFQYDADCNYHCYLGDALLLRYIHDCLDNNHGCLISIGYKNR